MVLMRSGCPHKLTLIAVDSGWWLLGQRPTQTMEDKLSRRFGLSNARQTNLATATQIKPDFNHQDLLESVQDLSGR